MVGKWQAKSGLPKHPREGSNAPQPPLRRHATGLARRYAAQVFHHDAGRIGWA